ncbi:class I SAM-dependent methyltransferase [Evansella sp. LMS18]|uniref:class I SAM-dependent methyltransferase n=1 Tax=Evansella sp. LMS18 TaxID=2924033 RepID=UPI0020D0B159|nr:class I SAM-dependent methyltransferase [Evansella sp. LMS18]UTR10787.1 class I SAM-dependent methyltransferase [Evansella sp. LMS18]
MDKLLVTTAGRPTEGTVSKAKQTARNLNALYIERKKRTVKQLIEAHRLPLITAGADKLAVYPAQPERPPFFFHPNAAMFRAKHWLKTKEDPLTDACRIEPGDSFFDATLGLGSDSILASLAAGKTGEVTGAEQSEIIAYIVKQGMMEYTSGLAEVDEAMRRVRVTGTSHFDWLKKQSDNSVDIIYFDPMFEESVSGSDGFDAMRPFTEHQPLTGEAVEEALRVAKKRVVLKDHFRSSRFSRFGFEVQVRPSATYHFGVIELNS